MGETVEHLLHEQLEELCEANKKMIEKAAEDGRLEEDFVDNFATVNMSIVDIAAELNVVKGE